MSRGRGGSNSSRRGGASSGLVHLGVEPVHGVAVGSHRGVVAVVTVTGVGGMLRRRGRPAVVGGVGGVRRGGGGGGHVPSVSEGVDAGVVGVSLVVLHLLVAGASGDPAALRRWAPGPGVPLGPGVPQLWMLCLDPDEEKDRQWTYKQTDRQREADRRTDRQIDRQRDI